MCCLNSTYQTKILNRLGDYYYGSNEITLAEAFMQQITHSFALYDGVTEGLLYSQMSDYNCDQLLQGYLFMHHNLSTVPSQ